MVELLPHKKVDRIVTTSNEESTFKFRHTDFVYSFAELKTGNATRLGKNKYVRDQNIYLRADFNNFFN